MLGCLHWLRLMPAASYYWVFAFLFCIACTSLHQPEFSEETLTYQGRFYLRYVKDQQIKNVTGRFILRQAKERISVQLLNPLGQTQALIESAPDYARLSVLNRAPVLSDNISELMNQTLGFEVPILGLKDWLQLRAHSPFSQTQVDPNTKRLSALYEEGWEIIYHSYFDQPVLHVKQLILHRETPQGPLDIRLVMDE